MCFKINYIRDFMKQKIIINEVIFYEKNSYKVKKARFKMNLAL